MFKRRIENILVRQDVNLFDYPHRFYSSGGAAQEDQRPGAGTSYRTTAIVSDCDPEMLLQGSPLQGSTASPLRPLGLSGGPGSRFELVVLPNSATAVRVPGYIMLAIR